MVEYGCLAPLSLLALVSNFSGIVDITRAPLLADILQGVWRLCAVFGAVVALTALPLSLRHGDSRRISWYLLFIPGVAAASTASELSMVLSESRASGVLTAGYLLWGASAAPALGLTIQNVRHRLHQGPSTKDLVVPLAPVSQLALGIMTLGIESRRVWADTVGPSTAPLLLGELAMAAGAILGLVLWAAAAAWLVNSHLIITMTAVPCNVISICGRLTESWQIVYPVASFAMATAVLARIWSSATALMLARILIAYLTVAICGLAGRALWKLWTATTIARSQRTSTSPSLTTPSSTSLYGSI
ncbi:hypothetical protein LPJ53_004764 [Coemansia erecta]|uniref:Uncharacterized protein n=1 Tax=Coemansia erecta TaxID=147472 RepID=A0A9W7XX36_9FUNG|nr:hypothetical protein LPJ53_004764 [Coemansia erecta]